MSWSEKTGRCARRGARDRRRRLAGFLRGWPARWLGLLAGWIAVVALVCAGARRAEGAAARMPESGAAATVAVVGMEGRVEVVLAGTQLEPKPLEERARVILRVAGAQPHGALMRYDLRFVGLVPGRYDLGDFLVRRDGTAVSDLTPIPVVVTGLLPQQHDGLLREPLRQPFARLGGYRVALTGAAALWVAGWVGWWVVRRKRRPPAQAPAPLPEPVLIDRIRRLAEQAARGGLSADDQARLERLLVAYWRERLALEGMDAAAAVARLKAHPEAGRLLRALESWLHRPPGAAPVDAAEALRPYVSGRAERQEPESTNP